MKLFEINDAIKQIVDRDDIDPVTLKDTLDSLELTRDAKLDGLAGLIERDTANIDFLAKKIKQLTEQKHHYENQKDNLLKYMTEVIDNADIKQLKTEHYILKPRNYRDKTIVSDEAKLPDKYKITKVTESTKVNTNQIYKDLKDGVEVPGAYLEPNRRTVIS
ncbi:MULTISPECIES: siphovirus Gp157 family protein [unclassified Lactobacillus]|uniref:siphovirus Gp157 family protein n=1 Tax=unclassified Lactobacillus TaxID=2620435 RepID=UPI000EFA3F2C|nr:MULTISPECIES: siphovirus Gp157 family protein [unclassified Lactobacillus]RMC24454.1 hypothetical protein F5ESL0247_04580 [Lactobacillus sp. ESL0247]RMC28593.1 hypothetical protein F5ESL0246_04580 [Lactobacillus sp. ESL0246]RMC31785.1 hypothetical protein F5ESL0245_04585 [Lactobacillus sp. ESL0245]